MLNLSVWQSLISLPLKGKVARPCVVTDEVAEFHHIDFMILDSKVSTSSPSYDGASPQGEALVKGINYS